MNKNRTGLLLAILLATLTLSGCDGLSTYLGRNDSTGASVIAPLEGILQSAIGVDDIMWADPDTNKTVDVVFDSSISSTEPSYRYFQYAEAVTVPMYKVGEGVNIVVDGNYHGDTTKSVDGDTNPKPMLVPIENIAFRSIDKNRWPAEPEAYTLSADYLDIFDIGPLFTNTGDTKPSVIFVLYEPAVYTNDPNREYTAQPMYFDVYYSVDYWNRINNQNLTEPAGIDTTDLTSPNEFGVCKYTQISPTTPSTVTITETGIATSSPSILISNGIFGCSSEPVPGLTNATSADNGDISFTLFDAMELEGNNSEITQEAVNKWTKYDFLAMLSEGSNTFSVASQFIEDTTRYLLGKSSYSEQNNLEVPANLYSRQAYETSIAACPTEAQRALGLSQYSVDFANGKTDTYYHNKTVIYNDNLYEKNSTATNGYSGARLPDNSSNGLNWYWCWFEPE